MESTEKIADNKVSNLVEALISNKDDLKFLREHLDWLNEILLSDNVDIYLNKLEKSGVLYAIFPRFDKVVRMQGKNFKSVWPHTMTVVRQAKPTIVIRWAALFHDFGKPLTFKFINKKVTFHNHENVSAKLFNEFVRNWNIISNEKRLFNSKESEKISFIIRHLGYVENYRPNWSESGVRRFARDIGEHVDDLLDLSRADITTKHDNKRERILNRIDELARRINEIKIKDAYIPPLPSGIGNLIMEITGLTPGKDVAVIKNKMEKAIENQILIPHQDIDYYKPWLENLVRNKAYEK